MLNINEANMWRDSSVAATSIAKPPNAWGRSQFQSGNGGPEVGQPGTGSTTNGGHIPSSNNAASSGGPTSRDNRLSFGQMFTPEDMAETVLFGAKGLEDAMERLNIQKDENKDSKANSYDSNDHEENGNGNVNKNGLDQPENGFR